MGDDPMALIGARDLLCVWTLREFKMRYAGSALGLAAIGRTRRTS